MHAHRLIEELGLAPLESEGGYFRETYRSEGSTAIYYLLTPDTFSAMHRLPWDEIFHFYAGDPVEMLQLRSDGTHSIVVLGHVLDAGHLPQVIVPKGTWQGCRLRPGGDWALMGTTVAPPFDPAGYEPGERASLTTAYPDCAEVIAALTR